MYQTSSVRLRPARKRTSRITRRPRRGAIASVPARKQRLCQWYPISVLSSLRCTLSTSLFAIVSSSHSKLVPDSCTAGLGVEDGAAGGVGDASEFDTDLRGGVDKRVAEDPEADLGRLAGACTALAGRHAMRCVCALSTRRTYKRGAGLGPAPQLQTVSRLRTLRTYRFWLGIRQNNSWDSRTPQKHSNMFKHCSQTLNASHVRNKP